MKKVSVSPGKFEGMSQYRPPLNFELVGRSFELIMDDGYLQIEKNLSMARKVMI